MPIPQGVSGGRGGSPPLTPSPTPLFLDVPGIIPKRAGPSQLPIVPAPGPAKPSAQPVPEAKSAELSRLTEALTELRKEVSDLRESRPANVTGASSALQLLLPHSR